MGPVVFRASSVSPFAVFQVRLRTDINHPPVFQAAFNKASDSFRARRSLFLSALRCRSKADLDKAADGLLPR